MPMTTYVIDRRKNGKNKSAVNRRRFLERYKKHIRRAVNDAVNNRSITDMERGESITIPSEDIQEPVFGAGQGGSKDAVHPGNKDFQQGDHIQKPQGGQGQGGSGEGASKEGEGEDDFTFNLSRDEFLEFLFEDLELPNMLRKDLKDMDEYVLRRAGFSSSGVPARVNIVRSMKNAYARRLALSGKSRKKLKKAKLALQETLKKDSYIEQKDDIHDLRLEIERLEKKIKKVPFLDDFDLRYNRHEKVPIPSNAAVMFCIMDVSGSMTQATKDIAKRFFLLLYMFLRRNYEKIEVVFIRHHTAAKEVDEEEFFYSRETGGTIVSSALEKMDEVIQARYPANAWNIYAAQASDGDNWLDDSPKCTQLLKQRIMPMVQYFSYIEITQRDHQSLWQEYLSIADEYEDAFAMSHIVEASDIYSVFRELFKKKVV
jgi:uncharacterized protein